MSSIDYYKSKLKKLQEKFNKLIETNEQLKREIRILESRNSLLVAQLNFAMNNIEKNIKFFDTK